MPSIKQEKMDVSSSSEDSEDGNVHVQRVQLKEFQILNTSVPPPSHTHGSSKKSDPVSKFRSKLRVVIVKRLTPESKMDLEFDMVGLDPSLANAIRRILISEVPTMAIEKVYMYNNTSILQDEVLCHRLGLIPLRADPRKFNWYNEEKPDDSKENEPDINKAPSAYGNSTNSLEFELKVRCKKNPDATKLSSEMDDLYIDHKVYTKHMKWIPRNDQIQLLSDGKEITPNPGPVEDDIMIVKLRPGHELDIRMVAIKGVGKDHAKFSPVATAYYRLLPEITLKERVRGEAAERLQRCFSPGVIDLVEAKSENGSGIEKEAVVKNARYDGCSRNVYRYDDLKDVVSMNKISDHFIFTVESTGALLPENLVVQAIDILADKCDIFLNELDRNVKKR